MPYTLKLLAQDLRRLVEMEVVDRDTLSVWYKEARRVQEKIKTADASLSHVPHLVWHYLTDADIRLKDPEYARMQNESLSRILAAMERGVLLEEE
jgi:hypothetical protein